jgi:hypothetical protein
VAIDDDELRRLVTGLLVLANTEVRDGTFFQTPESQEALGSLSEDLNRYEYTLALSASSADELAVQVRNTVDGVVSEVAGRVLRALMLMAGQFGAFCAYVREQAPELDIDAILQEMALAAARDTDQ